MWGLERVYSVLEDGVCPVTGQVPLLRTRWPWLGDPGPLPSPHSLVSRRFPLSAWACSPHPLWVISDSLCTWGFLSAHP